METDMTKVRPQLVGMNVGDEIHFPLEKLRTVRAQASELGAIYDRKYRTKMDRVTRLLYVFREK